MTGTTVERLLALDSCTVSDALDSLGLPAAVSGIVPLSCKKRIAGSAVTVLLGNKAPENTPSRHLGTLAIESGNPGNIIVIAHDRNAGCAGWGGVLSAGAKHAGIAGVVIDGPARDIDEAAEMEFPVFGSGPIARTARGRAWEQATNCPISLAGTPVNPGDLVLADSSGVVVLPLAQAAEIIGRAEKIMARERLMVEAIRRGEPATEVVGRSYEDMLKTLD